MHLHIACNNKPLGSARTHTELCDVMAVVQPLIPSTDELLAFAKKRLEMFAHVGVADNPHESTQVAASALHLPLSGPAYSPEAELFVPGIVKMRAMKWKGGMKSHQVDSAPEPLDIPPHGATTVEELEKLLPVAEAEEKRLYDIAYDMFMVRDGRCRPLLLLLLLLSKVGGFSGGACVHVCCHSSPPSSCFNKLQSRLFRVVLRSIKHCHAGFTQLLTKPMLWPCVAAACCRRWTMMSQSWQKLATRLQPPRQPSCRSSMTWKRCRSRLTLISN